MKDLRHGLALTATAGFAVAMAQTGVAVAADPSVASALSVSTLQLGPLDKSGYFAGYTTAIGAEKTTVSTIPVAKTGGCAEESGVAGQAFAVGPAETFSGALVFTVCTGGEEMFFVRLISSDGSWTDVPDRTEAGDKIKIKITEGRKSEVTASNLTQDWKAKVTGPKVDPVSYQIGEAAIALDEIPLPLPDFGKVAVTKTTVGGQDLAATESTKYNCVDGSTKRMTASNITGGTDFEVTFKSP